MTDVIAATVTVDTTVIDATVTVGAVITATATVAGTRGPVGPAGPTGPGVPAGGLTGQVLGKLSNTDLDTGWVAQTGGGGGGAVASVFGRTGVVVSQSGDYTAGQVGADVSGAAATAQSAAIAAAATDATSKANAAVATAEAYADTGDALALKKASNLSDLANTTTARTNLGLGSAATHPTTDFDASGAAAAAQAASQPLDADLTAIGGLDSSTAGAIASDGAGWVKKTYAQLKTALGLVKADVGLGNVDNTSDANKPVSTAQATADALALAKASNLSDLANAGTARTNLGVPAGSGTSTGTNTGDQTLPTALPPNGAASGDLSGTYPSPNVAKVNGTALSGLATGLLKNTTTTGVPSIAAAADVPTVAAGSTGPLSATDGTTTNSRTPTTHAASHASGGSDPVTLAESQVTNLTTDLAAKVPKSTVTAKGDLIAATGSGVVTNVAVGSDTFVLTADSAQSTGIKWAAAAGGGYNYFKSGQYSHALWASAAASTATMSLGLPMAIPMDIPVSRAFDRIGVNVTTAPASSTVRLGIYADGGGKPGTLIVDAGTVATTTTGGKEIVIAQTLSAGRVWLCVVGQGVAPGISTYSNTGTVPGVAIGTSPASSVVSQAAWISIAGGITGALPSTISWDGQSTVPMISLRAA